MAEVAKGIYERRALTLRADAEAMAGTAQKIAQTIEELQSRGGTLNVQPQVAFLTGALARMIKDWGVIEQLQAQGVSQRRPAFPTFRRQA